MANLGGEDRSMEPMDLAERRKLADEVGEYHDYYTDQLQSYFTTAIRQRRIYHNQLRDKRLPHEKWRAFVPQPYAWSATKSLSASFNELIFALNPPVQAFGVGFKDEAFESKFNRLFDYIMRKTHFRSKTKASFENALVEGTHIRKVSLIEHARDVVYFPTPEREEEFKRAIMQAVEEGLEMPQFDDPKAFAEWREKALQVGMAIPEMPVPGPKRIVRYKGPGYLDVNLYDMRFDPHLEPDEQVCVIQRAIRPRQWVLDRTGTDEGSLFDPEAVEEAVESGPSDEEFNEWQQQMAQILGVSTPTQNNPRLKNPVELWETWMPGNKKASYRVVMNRKLVINKGRMIPYVHGEHPYVFIRNHPQEGSSVGIPEFKNVERMFHELNTLRGLRLDAVLLQVLPVFIKARDAGLGDRMRQLVPGAFIESSRPEAVSALVKSQLDPSIFREIQEIRNDIDETVGSLPTIRGQQAAPRVSASSTENAISSSIARIKDRVIEFESELDPFVDKSLFIMYQFMPSEWRVRVGGDPDVDPFVKYSTEDFLEAIEMDYAFRGGSTAINRDVEAQQLRELFTVLANAQIPEFKSADFAKHMVDKQLKQSSEAFFRSEEEMQELAAQQQQQQAGEEGAPPQEEGAPPPEEGPPQ